MVTGNGQILVELAPEDTTAANLFDLNGRTLVFTPDGRGGYSRSVQPVMWEDEIGPAVADGTEISFQGFRFEFGGRARSSFFVNRPGLVTFGERLSYSYEREGRFDTMQKIAENFVTTPTISALFKPWHEGTQHVANASDRVVVTWISTEREFHVHGVPPERPARLQAVLAADGSIRLSYRDVPAGDGGVGLFVEGSVAKGALIDRIVDETDSALPAHLDLLEAAFYEANTDAVILEFTTRGSIPKPASGSVYSYRLHFDIDRPWWPRLDFADVDLTWAIDVSEGGRRTAWGPGVAGVVESDGANRISLLVKLGDLEGASASVVGDVVQFDDGGFVANDISSPALIALPTVPPRTDLSKSDRRFTDRQSEVFHYRSVPDLDAITCRSIEDLGDEFDLFVFHSEFRIDSQESTTPFNPYSTGAEGLGVTRGEPPCGNRLKGRWSLPVWMQASSVFDLKRGKEKRFDRGLALFTHEFTHAWTAHMSYLRNGKREPLFEEILDGCRCHWRFGLHTPAAFAGRSENPTPSSTMGGRYWRDNGDGTFTPLYNWPNTSLSWLDLYAMGLADAGEVPDILLLGNPRPVREGDSEGPHTAEREWVSIEQIVAAEGPRRPSAARAQKDFNAGFVYLVEPGRAPDNDMLRIHAEYRDKIVEHWQRITGGRSRMTTNAAARPAEPDPPDPDPPPAEGACQSGEETLCLQNGRFEVTADWWTAGSEPAAALVVPKRTNDSGLFRFFDENNWEILIKVLDGCAVNEHVWVYGASTTDLGYSIRVTDTKTGDFKEYLNEPGRPAPAITDAEAFPSACAERVSAALVGAEGRLPHTPGVELSRGSLIGASGSACAEADASLCLADSRFEVRVDWSTADGEEGPASTVPGRTNNSGLFYFFNADNWEMLIKVLDGCAINGHHWVYSAAATDLGLDIVVTDTATASTWSYAKEPGPPAPAITASEAFSDSCRP